MYYRKINNYTSRTNRRHKSVDMLGYPSNILGSPSKYCNYTSKRKLGQFPHPPPPLDNFFKGTVQTLFFIIRFYAIMHYANYKHYLFFPFFCPANIYRPSLGKVRLGRPNPNLSQPINIYLRRKKKTFYSELYAHNVLQFDFWFWFSFFFKLFLKMYHKTWQNV